MMRFYPGMSYEDILNLPVDVETELWEAITVLEAQETLLNFTIGVYPSMVEKARGKLHRAVTRKAYPRELYPTKTVSKETLLGALNAGGKNGRRKPTA